MGCAVAYGLFFGDAQLGELTTMLTALNVTIATASASTAFLVYSHAASSRNRAYLAVASTYLAVAWFAALLLLVTPDALAADTQPLGGPRSATWSEFIMHIFLPLGLGVTAVIMRRDSLAYRRRGRSGHVRAAITASLVVVVAITLLVTLGQSALGDISATGGAASVGWVITTVITLSISIASLLLLIVMSRTRYSLLTSWMIGVAALGLGGALVGLARPEPFSSSWLMAELFFLAAVMLIPVMMLSHLGQVERTAMRVADEDSLTGLTSRRGFLDRLGYEMERARALQEVGGLLWVDLDGFKAVNDQCGHAGGDEALRQVATRLRTAARPSDTVARLAGDEFGLLVADLGAPQDANAIADRALRALREPVVLPSAEMLLSASIGIVHFPTDEQDADELLHRADLAMYDAKHDGGDRIRTYHEPMTSAATSIAAARQRLARAVREDDFELHYQPMVNLHTHEIVGTEALLRWRRDGKIVDAGEFVPMAEVSGLIRPIGKIVLELLAADLGGADDLPTGFRVGLNLSVPELEDPTTVAELCTGALSSYRERLVVEVTEGVLLSEHARAVDNLGSLRVAGLALALDDFGSGFANVEALAALDPDLVKVDGSITAPRRTRRDRGDGLPRSGARDRQGVGCRGACRGH